MPKQSDKFQVGEFVWLKGDQFRRPQRWTEYAVVERTPRGYVIQQTGTQYNGRPYDTETISTVRANRDYVSAQVKIDTVWADLHRNRVLRDVQFAPPAMLREVARLIGYNEDLLIAEERDRAQKDAEARARIVAARERSFPGST